jgi:serine/threonine protein kinase
MKILDKEKIHKERMADSLRKEVLLMKMLNHPNVVKLEEVLSSRSKLFLVIELVNGGDLFELLDKQDYLNENHAREIF